MLSPSDTKNNKFDTYVSYIYFRSPVLISSTATTRKQLCKLKTSMVAEQVGVQEESIRVLPHGGGGTKGGAAAHKISYAADM